VLVRLALLCGLVAVLAAPGVASASPSIRYGVQDDAWIADGDGTLTQRLDRLKSIGVQIVRYNLRWDQVAAHKPKSPTSMTDPSYDWGPSDLCLKGLKAHGIAALVTIYGTPGWANGGHGPSWAPRSGAMTAAFAHAAGKRYPWVKRWAIWNEPNQRRWLRPTSPAVYTVRLLNPAYAAIHAVVRGAQVAGGVTAPRGNAGGVSPIDWIQGMKRAGARLDAYAHNPYPLSPHTETPWSGGCESCRTLTMATLPKLIDDVTKAFGPKRIWLTEYGYQTNPPDPYIGVSDALQAEYMSGAALRAYLAPRVDVLIHFLVRDEPSLAGWQSGLLNVKGVAKPSYRAFSLPLAQKSRSGSQTVLWGQVRPGHGSRSYRLQKLVSGRWAWYGGTARTSSGGFFTRTVLGGAHDRFRLWAPSLRVFGPPLQLR
jgi:hypothetical protein